MSASKPASVDPRDLLAHALRDASLVLDAVDRGRPVAADEPAHRTPTRVVSGPERKPTGGRFVVRPGWGERPRDDRPA
jgi:hypothetical protein